MEELVQVLFEEPSIVKLSSGVRTIKDRVLLAPGFWNGRHYTKEEISKAYNNTDWNDKDVISLVADHRDDDSKGRPLTIRDWIGFVSNQRLREDGYLIGDLNLCDSDLSTKLIDGKAPFGISPFVFGKFDKLTNHQRDFIFKNFAVVVEPACKESYINEYLEDDGLNEEIEKLSHSDRISKRIEINEKLNETRTSDISGSKIDSNGLQPIKTKKKKTNDISVKGGTTKMEESEKVENETTETEEEKVDEVSEPVESVPEEPAEEPEEESEEKLMEQLAKITEKLMNKRKLTPEQAKMQKLESELTSLRDEIKKLS